MIELKVETNQRIEMLDITSKVRSGVEKSGIKQGICVIFVPHTTAAVTINENADPNVQRDMNEEMSKIVPRNDGYGHSEGNSDGHIKSSLYGPSLTVLVHNGDLVLGTWQGIYFCEFDGPRRRKCFVKIVDG